MRAINDKQWLVIHSDITRIREGIGEPADMRKIILLRVRLLHQHLRIAAIPNARPILVRPAKAKREVRVTRSQHFVERTSKKPFACKPVVIVAKAGDSILPRQFGLRFARFRNTKIIKTEIGGQMRLIMPAKQRTCFRDVRPLSKSFAPPCVILGYRMILRQIKGDRAYRFIGHLLIRFLLNEDFTKLTVNAERTASK